VKTSIKWLLPLVALCSASANADTITYSDSGTFSASIPNSTFSAPSDTWSFAFQADSSPTLSEVGMGGFDFGFSNFSYSLDGSPIAITPTFIRFFSAANGGGFEICFSGMTVATCSDGLGTGFFNTQMYSGPTSAPTLLPGSFDLDEFGAIVDSVGFDLPNTTVLASAVPEPSTLIPLCAGLLALGVRRRYWRR
jgi:PEP-CTERM motif